AKCGGCHKSALAFWKKTVHASAWKTLVEGGKQNDYKCVSCHVTGYGQVGGSSLGHTDRLRNLQCETCHGPAPAPPPPPRGAWKKHRRSKKTPPPAPARRAIPNSTPIRSSTKPTCATSSASAT